MAIFDGLGMSLGNLSRLSDAKTRSISGENPTGEKGKGAMATEGSGAKMARELGQGWKVNPWYSPYQNQLGFRLNSTLFDDKEWPSTLLHGQISASRTALFFRIITISMFTFTD